MADARVGRNPAWARDELILALDLYLSVGMLRDDDWRVIEVSSLLNSLPIHLERPDATHFRSPNSVALKLANFAALDPAYPGAGMSRGGRLDADVWDTFVGSQQELHAIAIQLRDSVVASNPPPGIEEEEDASEGRLLFRRHRSRERNRRIVAAKKRTEQRTTGHLQCAVCEFDFAETYGELGDGFIECHHTIPLSKASSTLTRLSDLVLLCANCHRMAHRGFPWPTVDQLRQVVRDRGQLVKSA
jgi:5-methylcytosine-specific restriction protein A